MHRRFLVLRALVLLALLAGLPLAGRSRRQAPRANAPARFVAEAANDPAASRPLRKGSAGSAVLRLQVLLDRARFCVGEIDGRYGANTRRAVRAFRSARGLPEGEETDDEVWRALADDAAPVVVPYTLTADDLAGPFTPIPEEMEEKAALSELGFANPMEALAERFHASPRLLGKLSPNLPLEPGTTLWVPSVERPPLPRVSRVHVSGADLAVRALDGAGRLLARYPATVGSEHDPLPEGSFTVKGVSRLPRFSYDPELFWDSDEDDEKVKLPPGPNSPVGVVWIDLTKPHYGIHGTAEPHRVGHTTSHGCIRLTNWDAWELADAVRPGTAVTLER